MVPSKEMLEAWFEELQHHDKGTEMVWYWAGIAAYCHLKSTGSEDWRREHGFLNDEQDDRETIQHD